MTSIHISKPFLPPFEEYTEVIRQLWVSHQVTNNGPLIRELESKLAKYLGVEHLIFCTNGTVALQLALSSFPQGSEVITTPFSYIATLDSIVWTKCSPVFADIDEHSWCINPEQVEKKITTNTKAILATHIFGRPCDTDTIGEIALRHQVPVIYDGAHSFGCLHRQRSLLSYGDISVCSFNATKMYHTIEGGCVIVHEQEHAEKIKAMRSFGIVENHVIHMGTNAKQSEFHAAIGLVNFKYIDDIKEKYAENFQLYCDLLRQTTLKLPETYEGYNHGYFPVLFTSESQLLSAQKELAARSIFSKRYFHPSLNRLSFISYQSCPKAEEIAGRVLCLPMYYDLSAQNITAICDVLK